MSQRIRRAEWLHDGQRWTAEVGQKLRGVQETRTFRGKPGKRVYDPATVVEIGNGSIITDGAPGTQWNNPIYTGTLYRVEYFEESEAGGE